MLSVEQVRSLDGKVRQALKLIDTLKGENNMLKGKLDEYKERIEQLESVVDGFKLEQLEIEEGIKDVLSQLDQLEDQITSPSPSNTEISEPQAVTTEVIKAAPQELGAAGIEIADDNSSTSQKPEPEQDPEPSNSNPPELEIF